MVAAAVLLGGRAAGRARLGERRDRRLLAPLALSLGELVPARTPANSK